MKIKQIFSRAFLAKATSYASTHKFVSSIVVIAVALIGYWGYGKLTSTAGQTLYVLGTVQTNTVISTVSGSGQVLPSNQVDIKAKVSADVISVLVKEGQSVKAGQAIAYLDPTKARQAVQSAQTALDSARLALEKLQQPADTLTLLQAQDALIKAQQSKQDAENSLAKDYNDGFTQTSSLFLDLSNVLTGLNSVLFSYDRTLGGVNQQNIDYYTNSIAKFDERATAYHDDAQTKYADAKTAYDKTFTDYQATDRTSATSTIENLMQESYTTTKMISAAVKSALNLIQLYQNAYSSHGISLAATSNTHITNLGSYNSTVNSNLASLFSFLSSIKSDEIAIATAVNSIAESQASLDKTKAGADPLDLRSSQITVQDRQDSLANAQATLADYTVRAPFDGTVAKVDIKKGDSSSGGTVAATLITQQQIAQLSLNEVDAAKVKTGQRVTLTFDAIDGLSLTGKVVSVDTLGTVTQGVVSYSVEIALDTQDARVKPGMTVNADIQTDVHQNVLTVPSSAVKTQNGQSSVQAFNPPLSTTGGTLGIASKTAPQSIPVAIGISDDTNTEIASGLTEGEQIVVRTTSSTAKTPAATATARSGGGGFGGGIRL